MGRLVAVVASAEAVRWPVAYLRLVAQAPAGSLPGVAEHSPWRAFHAAPHSPGRNRPLAGQGRSGAGLGDDVHVRQQFGQPRFDVGHGLVAPRFAVRDVETGLAFGGQPEQELPGRLLDLLERAERV